ncbi:hypothetical protein N0V95_003151 [Ascochyta clinopodiicola]|nr:hypothetical protein N0V95_003151 [Ascochyta clinopodiicola]
MDSAAWSPVLDEDGNVILPTFVREHLEKRVLPIRAKSTRSTSDVDTKVDGSSGVEELCDDKLHTFSTPSWFPFRFFFHFHAHPFFMGFASEADWLRVPPSVGLSLLEKKNAEIAALEVELEDTLMELDDKNEEMRDMRIFIAQKVEGQRVDLAAAHKDVDSIRMSVREIVQKFRKLGDLNKVQVGQIEALKKTVHELKINNKILTIDNEGSQQLNEELQRENETCIKTMHALHDQDKTAENERLKEQLFELQASHNRMALANLTLQNSTAYLHRISAKNAEAATTTQTKLDNALWDAEGLREDISTSEEKLQTALHESAMLRSELSDKEKALTRLSTTSQHSQAQLNSQLDSLRATSATEQAQLSQALDCKTRLLSAMISHDTATARRTKVQISALTEALRSQQEHSADTDRELEFLRHTYAETTRFPLWESGGFKDEGIGAEEVDEWGYASAETLELSECEGGSDSEFEEVVLEGSVGGFVRVSCFSGEDETETESESQSEDERPSEGS